jgi:hypothetical protein
VKGRVIEDASRAPLVAAFVALLVDETPVITLVTDSLGNFIASVHDVGTLHIRVSRIGYTEIVTRELDPGPTGFTIDDHVTSGSIVALEIYPGMVTPTRYPSRTNCGSIVIRTGVEGF